jgi:hypothetical protein
MTAERFHMEQLAALEEAYTVPATSAKPVYAGAMEAVAAYARQAKDTQLIEHATEIKVRAERRAGELLRASAESGERKGKGQSKEMSKAATLLDLGITRDQSSRWQQVASIPAKHFEAAVQMAKNTAGEVTTAFLLREAKSIAHPRGPARPGRCCRRRSRRTTV